MLNRIQVWIPIALQVFECPIKIWLGQVFICLIIYIYTYYRLYSPWILAVFYWSLSVTSITNRTNCHWILQTAWTLHFMYLMSVLFVPFFLNIGHVPSFLCRKFSCEEFETATLPSTWLSPFSTLAIGSSRAHGISIKRYLGRVPWFDKGRSEDFRCWKKWQIWFKYGWMNFDFVVGFCKMIDYTFAFSYISAVGLRTIRFFFHSCLGLTFWCSTQGLPP